MSVVSKVVLALLRLMELNMWWILIQMTRNDGMGTFEFGIINIYAFSKLLGCAFGAAHLPIIVLLFYHEFVFIWK